MGREIRRVPLDFNWPISQIWKGYYNPYSGLKCSVCNGSGESSEYKELSDTWYGFNDPVAKWCYSITQDEVQALVDGNRLWDFTRVPRTDAQHEVVKQKIADGGNSWLPEDSGYIPTAAEVNEWAQYGMGHDSINQHICVKARAKRLGVTEDTCSCCDGEGMLWPEDKYAELWENFEYIEPPTGGGYQMWETVTEGSPISPVFDTPEELAHWLADNGASAFGSQTATYEQWLVICKSGWAPSAIGDAKGIRSGVEALAEKS